MNAYPSSYVKKIVHGEVKKLAAASFFTGLDDLQ
jgi:hypothetical protein